MSGIEYFYYLWCTARRHSPRGHWCRLLTLGERLASLRLTVAERRAQRWNRKRRRR